MKQKSILHRVVSDIDHTVSFVTPMNDGHMHNKNEFFFLAEGNMTARCNTQTVQVKGPAVLIFASYSVHSAASLDETVYDRYKMFLDDEILMDSPFDQNDPLIVIPLEEKQKERLLFYFDVLSQHRGAAAVEHLAKWMLYELSCQQCRSNPSRRDKSAYIHSIMRYLAENYQRQVSLEALAQSYYISRAKLVADFKRESSMTVNEYLSLIRLNNAKSLLEQGMSVGKAAQNCGYHDESYFIRKFTRYFGYSPGTYIKKLKAKSEG